MFLTKVFIVNLKITTIVTTIATFTDTGLNRKSSSTQSRQSGPVCIYAKNHGSVW